MNNTTEPPLNAAVLFYGRKGIGHFYILILFFFFLLKLLDYEIKKRYNGK